MPILTPEERVGSSLAGKYVLERIVASGGMATVYAGVHEWTHRAVAVKILNYEYARDEEVARRFLQEARTASQLVHPNVVGVLDMGKADDGTVYLVLELLEGETLKQRMRRSRRLALEEISVYLTPVMRAVAAAHRKGVVHRDLKPDNVFLARDEEGTIVPKLLDFGIAKVGTGDSGSTRTGTMVGTPQYMSPEQVRGERDVGPPADVWSMGVVLYACLSGRRPFDGDSAAAVIAKVLVERPAPLLAVAPHLPPGVAKVVERALAVSPADRYAHMGEMLDALVDALDAAEETTFDDEPSPSEMAAAPTLVHTLPPEADAPSDVLEAADDAPAQSALLPVPPSTITPTPAGASSPRGPWIAMSGALVLAAITVIGAASWWLGAGTPEMTASPAGPPPASESTATRPSAPAPTPMPARSSTPAQASAPAWQPAPTSAAPAPAAAATTSAPASAPTAAAPASAPTPARARISAPTEAATAPRAAADAPDTAPVRPASRDVAETDTPPRRAPRRGTGGALILR